ncbi:MAG: hypothetical protein II706_01090 [Bacteroidaceae bacterium]|nr:hypothetical protein [Bacteroidaceae bacterium]
MNKIDIKQAFWSIMLMVVMLFGITGCMSDNENESSPKCAIISFAVGNISSPVVTKKYDSKGHATDTIVTKTISGSEIFFNIDQVNGRIYNIDSLPNWASLRAVVPTFSSYGTVYYVVPNEDNLYYTLTSGKDSIDFTKPVQLLCVSSDTKSSRFYTVEINRHVANTDTLEWRKTQSNLNINELNKVLVADSKVFAFGKNASGQSVVTWAEADDATTWSSPVNISVDEATVTLFEGQFYGMGTDGYLYKAQLNEKVSTWLKASNQKVKRLLGADGFRLYAYDGNAIIGSSDLDTWTEEGTTDLDMLPESRINATSYATSTNKNIEVAVMTGLSSKNDKYAVVWYKASSDDVATNQSWAYIQVTKDNPYGLPAFSDLSTTYYHNALWAIGTVNDQYKYLYRSDDNGITWHPQTELYPVPTDLDPANGKASIVAVGKKLWIVQENGNVWQGSIE